MIVRWGLAELPALLRELGVERPLLIASRRWSTTDLPVEAVGVWSEVPTDRIAEVAWQASAADGLLALGGGSAIDLAKAVSVEAELPVVSVPTTYSGAEWATGFGIRDPNRRMAGGGSGGRVAGIAYEPRLTLSLPRETTVGTALNGLAHCAEALYVRGHGVDGDARAVEGAALIARHLPRVVDRPDDLGERTALLHGAAAAGEALALNGLGLGHAMAQAVGGRYGLPHGVLNAICLPPALAFNREAAIDGIERFGRAIGSADPVRSVQELARLGGFERLRELGVPSEDLPLLAAAAATRTGARANPRSASAGEIEELLRSVW